MCGEIDGGTSAGPSSSAEASVTDLDSGGVNLSSGRSRLRGSIGSGTSDWPSSSEEASLALENSAAGLDGGNVFERGALVRFLCGCRYFWGAAEGGSGCRMF